jgi:MFS family permease
LFRTLLFKTSPTDRISGFVLKNMRWLFYDGVFASASLAIINIYFTLYLESLGASNQQIGLTASLTNLMLLLTMLPGAWLTEKIGSRKTSVLLSAGGLSRLFLLVSVFLPFWFSGQAAVLPVIVARLLMDNFSVLSLPAWTSLSADIVPMQWRGRYFAARNMAMNISTMIASLAIGRLIFAIGKPGGYQAALGIATALGFLATFAYARIREPKAEEPKTPSTGYSPKALLATLKEDPLLRNYSIFMLMWSGTINFAGPFFAIYFVRELHGTPDIIGVLVTLLTLAGIPATYFAGKLVDRFGGWRAQIMTGFLIPFLPMLWILPRSPWALIPVYIYDGIAWSSYALASFSFVLTMASPARLTRYNAIAQLMVAFGSALGPALGGLMIAQWGYRTVFFISGIGRLLAMLFFVRFVRQPAAAQAELEVV